MEEGSEVQMSADGRNESILGELPPLGLEAGFRDLWAEYRDAEVAAGRSAEPGFTCCHDPDLSQGEAVLDQRIDFVFHRGSSPMRVLEMARVGIDPSRRSEDLGLWPSDHAGLVARVAVTEARSQNGPGRRR